MTERNLARSAPKGAPELLGRLDPALGHYNFNTCVMPESKVSKDAAGSLW